MARNSQNELVHTGLYVGDDLETYLAAARQSREQNITVFDKPVQKMVCVMQADEFVSTWVANKAVYRTRMALADDGELLIIAPGLKRFGEQPEVDALIRKYGYTGTPRMLEQYRIQPDMQDLAHATAHLIHGSSEGRFKITYAPGHLTKAEVEGVNFGYADLQPTFARYQPERLKEGWNRTADGEEFFFIPTPSAGLWSNARQTLQPAERVRSMSIAAAVLRTTLLSPLAPGVSPGIRWIRCAATAARSRRQVQHDHRYRRGGVHRQRGRLAAQPDGH